MIQTESLRFAYPADEGQKPVYALRGVDLEIKKGSFVVILGHNGSGKSTLAKHMNAVLLPGGGTVWVDGMDTSDENLLLEVRRRVGMVFQNPDNQIVPNVVEEDVAFGPENLGVPTEELQRRVDAALKAVGMEEFTLHAPHHLSGGQKQRIAIAGVIAMEPACIALDESTAMLDPMGRREVLDTVQKLHREKGITIVLVSHSMEDVAKYVERIIVMNQGEVMYHDTPREVFRHYRELEAVGLAAPEVTYLMHALKEKGFRVDADATTVEEARDTILAALGKGNP